MSLDPSLLLILYLKVENNFPLYHKFMTRACRVCIVASFYKSIY
jgi:hypothetical protein